MLKKLEHVDHELTNVVNHAQNTRHPISYEDHMTTFRINEMTGTFRFVEEHWFSRMRGYNRSLGLNTTVRCVNWFVKLIDYTTASILHDCLAINVNYNSYKRPAHILSGVESSL